jgi:glutathione S-transferase
MFAALNTIEPPILELTAARLFERDKPWAAERVPLVDERVRNRLKPLSARLGDAEWLDGAFSAGDLLMVSVAAAVQALWACWTNSRPGGVCRPRGSAACVPAGVRRRSGRPTIPDGQSM